MLSVLSYEKLISRKTAKKNCWKFLTSNKLKEIFEYCSEWELNMIRLKSLEMPTFNLDVPLRKNDVN